MQSCEVLCKPKGAFKVTKTRNEEKQTSLKLMYRMLVVPYLEGHKLIFPVQTTAADNRMILNVNSSASPGT